MLPFVPLNVIQTTGVCIRFSFTPHHQLAKAAVSYCYPRVLHIITRSYQVQVMSLIHANQLQGNDLVSGHFRPRRADRRDLLFLVIICISKCMEGE